MKYLKVLFVLLFAITIHATNYYVYKNATGSNNGTSWLNAWTSFTSINWNIIQPGDYVYISGGQDSIIYTQTLTPGKSGTWTNLIYIFPGKYSPFPAGHSGRVIIQAGGNRSIYVQNKNYLWIKGFELRGSVSGFEIEDKAQYVICDSMNIYGFTGQAGVRMNTNNFEDIDSCVVKNCRIETPLYSSGQTDGMYFQRCTRLLLYNNYIHQRNQNLTAHVDCIQGNNNSGAVSYNNICINDSVNSSEGGGTPMIFGFDGVSSSTPSYNIMVANSFLYCGGMWYSGANLNSVWWSRSYVNQYAKCWLINNTIVSNGPRVRGVIYEYQTYAVNNIIAQYNGPTLANMEESLPNSIYVDSTRNNIFYKQGGNPSFAGSFTGNGQTGTPTYLTWFSMYGGTGQMTDPKLVNHFGYEPNQGILSPALQQNSPAINAGNNVQDIKKYIEWVNTLGFDGIHPHTKDIHGIEWRIPKDTDLYGNLRDNSPDIGAYEYNSVPQFPIRYFSKNGNNSDGLTWATAWNNTNSINWNQLSGGGYLLFDGGVDSMVYNITIDPASNGSWGKYIYIMPARYYYGVNAGSIKAGHSGKVIINHNFNGGSMLVAAGTGNSWIYFKGFIGRNIGYRALYVGAGGPASHVVFDSCEVWGVADDDPLDIMGNRSNANLQDSTIIPHHIEIKYCTLVTQDNKTTGGQEEDVVYIDCAGDIWIHHCILWQRDNHNCTSGDCPHVDNIQVAFGAYGLKIYNNILIRDSCVSGANMILGLKSRYANYGDTTLIYNNYMYTGGMYGCGSNWTQQILWRAPETPGNYIPLVYSINNTLVASNDASPNSAAEGSYNPIECNNIIIQLGINGAKPSIVPNTIAQWYTTYNTGDYKYADSMRTNLVWQKWDGTASFGGNRWRHGSSIGTPSGWLNYINNWGGSGVNANPQFINDVRFYWTKPYKIPSNSPAVDAGTNMSYILNKFLYLPQFYVNRDIEGNQRSDGAWDIGCYEYPDPMPVELISFAIANINEFEVTLEWETATEINNYGFYLERSTDNTTFESVAFIKGNGNSNSPKQYSYIDVLQNNGTYYYRLKQVDIDGTYKYYNSIICNVHVAMKLQSKFYPNPFNSSGILKILTNETPLVDIDIYNILGEKVYNIKNNYKLNNYNIIEVNANTLPSGIYFIIIKSSYGILSKNKIVLIK